MLFLPPSLNIAYIGSLSNSWPLSTPCFFVLSPKPVSPSAHGEMLLLFFFPSLSKGNSVVPCWGYPHTALSASLNIFSGGHSTPESSHHFIWNQSLQVHQCQENYAHLHQHVTWSYLFVIFRSTVLYWDSWNQRSLNPLSNVFNQCLPFFFPIINHIVATDRNS